VELLLCFVSEQARVVVSRRGEVALADMHEPILVVDISRLGLSLRERLNVNASVMVETGKSLNDQRITDRTRTVEVEHGASWSNNCYPYSV